MSPEHASTDTDRESERRRPGRPAVPREVVLAAADELFAATDEPRAVSMDDVAAAAGVGKGTLFRAFGSRDGLLDALFVHRSAPLRDDLDRVGSPVGPDVPPPARILAILDELISFKFDNRHLTTARELTGSRFLHSPHYRWVHDRLRALIEQIDRPEGGSAVVTAHVLLGALRVDLLDELLAQGWSSADIRKDVAALALRLLGPPRAPG